jgi:hypothetical protein
LAAPLVDPVLEGLDIDGRIKGMGKHPARSFQVVVVIKEMAQEQEFFVGALARDLGEHIAGMAANPFIIHLRKIPESRNALLPAERQLLFHHAHCFRIVVPEKAHNGVALSKHCS